MSNTSKADQFLATERDIQKLRTGYDRFLERQAKESNMDKHSFCFGSDGRFASFRSMVILETYTGYYGNSSCSTFLSFQNEVQVSDAFQTWINRNMKTILSGMADILEEKATKQKEEYVARLRAELDRLEAKEEA